MLKEYPVNPRLQLFAGWVAVMFCYIYGDYFELYVPGKAEGLISGDHLLNSPYKLWAASVLMAVPALLMLFTLYLKPVVVRWLNGLAGIFYTLIMIAVAVMSVSEWRLFYLFLAVLEISLTLFITLTAFRWPKEE